MPSPISRMTAQYFASIAAAAARPASAAQPGLRVSKERRKNHVVSAHVGVIAAFALYLMARKLKNGTSVMSASPATRLSPGRYRPAIIQMTHSASVAVAMDRR